MITLTQLLELHVGGLEAFANEWNVVHRKMKEARDAFHDDVIRKITQDDWQGDDAEAARKFCRRIQMDIDALDQEIKSLRDFLDREADGARGEGGIRGIEGLQHQATDLQQQAMENGMTVRDDGTVDWSVAVSPDGDNSNLIKQKEETANSIQRDIKKVLNKATEIDEWLSVSLKVVFGTKENFEAENRRFDIVQPTDHDRKVRNQLNNVAAYFATVKGWPTAAGLVKHYLDGTGKPVEVEPQQMMQDIPAFREDVEKSVKEVANMKDGTFTTQWKSTKPNIHDGDSSLEWYYALNHFQYRLVGEKQGNDITYHVEVQKRYDWGIPSEHRRTVSKDIPFMPDVKLEQADLAHLHSSGLARDFDVHGSSDVMRVSV